MLFQKEKLEVEAIQKQIGFHLAYFRIKKEWTIKNLSQKTKINEQKLSLYEIGKMKISLEELVKLTFSLNCSIYDFITDKEELF